MASIDRYAVQIEYSEPVSLAAVFLIQVTRIDLIGS
jgi:hypothetical protein